MSWRVTALFAVLALAALLVPASTPPLRAASISDTVYTDPDAGVAPLVSFISQARHTLEGEVYLVSSKPVLAALEAAAARRVAVRINLERHPYGTGAAITSLISGARHTLDLYAEEVQDSRHID